MRAGKRPTAPLALALLLLAVAAPPVAAAAPSPGLEGLAARVRDALPFLPDAVPEITPQAVSQADPDGPTVNITRLDDATRIERELRAALRDPLDATRLTVPAGIARLGSYTLGSAEVQRGHVVVLRGHANIHGRIEGNLVTLDGDITVHPGAMVVGDLLAIGGRVREAGGTIIGGIQSLEALSTADTPAAATLPATIASRGAGAVGVFLTFLILGFGLVTFGRPNLEIVSDTVTHAFGRSFLAGVLGQILLLPTFGMLVVGLVLTVAGVLLVPFAVVVYALLAIVAVLGGLLAVAHAMGERITRRRMAHGVSVSPNSYRYFATGLAGIGMIWFCWVAFGWVPVAGSVIFAAALLGTWFVTTVGFGAALLSRGGIREDFTGRLLPPAMMTDEYLWATPQFGVPAVKRPPRDAS